MSYIITDKVEYKENQQLDAYGRLRTANVTTLFDSPLKHHEEVYLWNSVLENGGTATYTLTENLLEMDVSVSGDKVIRQTKQYFQLQSGKSHLGFLGVVFGSNETDVIKQAGVYDDNNGFYIKYTNNDVKMVIRTHATGTTTEVEIPQSQWNIDSMDGNGESGVNVDFTKLQIIVFDISYTGNGAIRFGFMVDNKIIYAHKHSSFNVFSTNNLSTPSLPIRYEIESTGGVSWMKQQSSSILVEGEYNQRGIVRSVDTGQSAVTVGQTLTPVLSLKLKDEYRSSVLKPISFNILQTSNNTTLYYAIYMFTTLINPQWEIAEVGTNCLAQYDTAATGLTGGIKIASGYIPSKSAFSVSQEFRSILNLAGNYDGTTDIITIAIAGVEGSVPCFTSLTYNEVY